MTRRTTHSLNELIVSSNNLADVEISSTSYNTSQNVHGSSFLNTKSASCDSSQQSLSTDKYVDYTQTPLYRAFSPLMISLKLLGMHHTRTKSDDGKLCAAPTISQVYSWFITIIAWAFTVRIAATLRLANGSGASLLMTLSMMTWSALCALNATCFLNASHNSENMKEYFLGFVKLKKYGGSFVCPIKTRKYVLIGSVTAWLVVFINITVLGYLINTTQMFDVLASDPLQPTDTTKYPVLKIIYTLLNFFLIALWVFPSAMQLSACLIIYQELKHFCISFSSKITDDGEFTGQSLEPERKRFLQIVNIIESADNCLSLHQSSAFACNVINICLILYIIISYPAFISDPSAKGVAAFWLFYSVADISVIITSGVLINSEVSVLQIYCYFWLYLYVV